MLQASDDEGSMVGLDMDLLVNKKKVAPPSSGAYQPPQPARAGGFARGLMSDDSGDEPRHQPTIILASRSTQNQNSAFNSRQASEDEEFEEDVLPNNNMNHDDGGGGVDTDLESDRGGGGGGGFFGGVPSRGGYQEPQPMTQEELLNAKREVLYQLGRLEKKGVRVPKLFTLASNFDEMKAEYDRLKRDIEVDASVRFQRRMLMACVSGVEFLNNRFDPFEVHLDGWSETVQDSINDYDDIFEELHDKYRGKMKMAPELRLMFTLGGSAVWFHMTHSMFRQSTIPGVEQVFAQNPELKRQFMQAAMNTMQHGGGSADAPAAAAASARRAGGGGGGGMFGGLGNLASGLFGGGRGGASAPSPPPAPRSPMPPPPAQRRSMRGPSGVDEILMEINDERFGAPSAGVVGGGGAAEDPARLFEIFSNSGGETDADDDDGALSSGGASQLSSDDGGEGGNMRRQHGGGSGRRRVTGGGARPRRRTLTLD